MSRGQDRHDQYHMRGDQLPSVLLPAFTPCYDTANMFSPKFWRMEHHGPDFFPQVAQVRAGFSSIPEHGEVALPQDLAARGAFRK